MRKSIKFILILFLVAILFIAGCSPSKDTSQDNVSDGPSEIFNETGFPIVDEEVTLKFFARRSPPNGPYEDMLVFKEYEKMTNLNIEWEDVAQDGFDERKNLVFASGELPDALYKAAITPLEAIKY